MSAILIRPIAAAPTCTALSRSRKLGKPYKICVKKLDSFGEFDSIKSVSWASRRIKGNFVMGLNRVPGTTSEKGVQAFEQEALVEGSLNLRAGSLEATLNSLSKWLGAICFVAIALWRHDAEAMWATMGAVLNAILGIVLKRILNQERPISTLRSNPGMPSSHAQSLFYIITFLNVSLLEWYGVNGLTATLCGLSFIFASYFSYLRVSQQFHTINQVIVGAVLGSIFGILWFWSWQSFVLNLFVSFLPVRIFVVLGTIGFSVGFIHHVFRTWIKK